MAPPKLAPTIVTTASADSTKELPLSYTSFFAPPPINAKNVASQYMRTENQTWLGRNGATETVANGTAALAMMKNKKRKRFLLTNETTADATPDIETMVASDDEEMEDEDGEEEGQTSSSSQTIVIYPGSQYLRIGLSSDLAPVEIPHVLARRDGIRSNQDQEEGTPEEDVESEPAKKSDLAQGTEALRADLRSIMRNMKLRPVANGRQQTSNYNAGVKPEKLAEHQDVFAIDWTESGKMKEDVIVGERAERLDCFSTDEPQKTEKIWKLFQPFKGGHFNYEEYAAHYGQYACHGALVNDIITIWSHAISADKETEKETAGQVIDHGLGIPRSDWPFYNVVIVIPDIFLSAEVESLINILLQDMGFSGVMIQQESVCTTFGSGLSSACVIHVGSEKTHVSCVDEGLVISDSRTALDYGGDHISTFFMHLLQKSNFPYQDFDLKKRFADRWLANELKERLCTMDPTQLGLAINDFHVRLPKKQTLKFSLRTYDEIIIGPMCLFNPRVIKFPKTRRSLLPLSSTSILIDEEAGETESGVLPSTLAMTNCVRHLLPPPPTPPIVVAPEKEATTSASGLVTAEGSKAGTPAPAGNGKPETQTTTKPTLTEGQDGDGSALPSARASPLLQTPGTNENKQNKAATTNNGTTAINNSDSMEIDKPEIPSIDIPYEASKVALDWAVWNSILSSVSSLTTSSTIDERMKRMVSNMFCVGGTALMPGLGMAIEARIQNYLQQWFEQQKKDLTQIPNVSVIPPPRDMDPRIVTWKGMAVMARLDSTQDMWILRNEWKMFGMRALREKAYFM